MDPNQTDPNQGGDQPMGTPVADPNAGQTGQDMPTMPETPAETPAVPETPATEQPQPEQGQGDQGIGGAPAV